MKWTIPAASLLILATASNALADAPKSRGDLMRICMAEWKAAKAKPPGGEKLVYTAFLSDCLKRHNTTAPAGAAGSGARQRP